jgi:hypothetical protein
MTQISRLLTYDGGVGKIASCIDHMLCDKPFDRAVLLKPRRRRGARGKTLIPINEVKQRPARLVLGWATVSESEYLNRRARGWVSSGTS